MKFLNTEINEIILNYSACYERQEAKIEKNKTCRVQGDRANISCVVRDAAQRRGSQPERVDEPSRQRK